MPQHLTEWPSSEWDLNFSEQGGTTTVRIMIQYATLAVLEMMIEEGFKERIYGDIQQPERTARDLIQKKELK